MAQKMTIQIELRYMYNVEVIADEDDMEDAKEHAFTVACLEHAECTAMETGTYNLSDTWQAYDTNGEKI